MYYGKKFCKSYTFAFENKDITIPWFVSQEPYFGIGFGSWDTNQGVVAIVLIIKPLALKQVRLLYYLKTQIIFP